MHGLGNLDWLFCIMSSDMREIIATVDAVANSHAWQDVASMLYQLIQVRVLATFLMLLLEKHLQSKQTLSLIQKPHTCCSCVRVLIKHTSRCCSSVKVCMYNSKYF